MEKKIKPINLVRILNDFYQLGEEVNSKSDFYRRIKQKFNRLKEGKYKNKTIKIQELIKIDFYDYLEKTEEAKFKNFKKNNPEKVKEIQKYRKNLLKWRKEVEEWNTVDYENGYKFFDSVAFEELVYEDENYELICAIKHETNETLNNKILYKIYEKLYDCKFDASKYLEDARKMKKIEYLGQNWVATEEDFETFDKLEDIENYNIK